MRHFLSLRWVSRASTIACLAALGLSRPALAEEPERRVFGKVVEARSEWADQSAGAVVTRLVVALSMCDGKPCAGQLRLVVPGGRIGTFEQRVVDLRVPAAGEKVFLSLGADHVHLSLAPPAASDLKGVACR